MDKAVWVNTPKGIGIVMARSDVPTHQTIHMAHGETFEVYDRDPFVDVFISGPMGGIYSFPPSEVQPAEAPNESGVKTKATTLTKTGGQPSRGQFRKLLARLPETFTVSDMKVALLQAVGDREIDPVESSLGRRIGALMRQMVKKGYAKPG